MRKRIDIAMFLLILGTVVGTAAQETTTLEEETGYFEEVAVEIVNVEVYVTDGDGNPVVGLTIDDFEVLEDKRPVELLNFYAVSDGKPTSLNDPVDDTPVDPLLEPEAELDEIAYPEEQRLNLIIYVDNLFIHPLNRNRVFDRLRGFINDTLKPGDQVMVASYDRSLHIRHPFSSDIASVSLVLDEAQKLTGYAQTRELERSEAVREIYESTSLHSALFKASSFADNARNEAEESIDGLREMLESLAGLPGRKMLVHVSDGLPAVPGQDLFQAVQQQYADQSALAEAMGYDLSQRYVHLIADANSNRVSFYTIDAAGLRTQSGIGADTRAVNSPTGVSMAVDSVRTSNLQDTLINMADRTGGQAVFNTNDVADGLQRITRDFNNYYSLGYRAPGSRRGRYHDIQVRLPGKEKGWRIRHREGYRDKPVATQMEDAINAYFVHGFQTNPLDASIDVGSQTRTDDGTYNVPIRVRIPIKAITLVPRPGLHEAQLQLYFSAIDEKGSKAPVAEMPLELRVPDESLELAMQDELTRVINLAMKPGPHKFVVGVRDEISEVRSILGRYVTVGQP